MKTTPEDIIMSVVSCSSLVELVAAIAQIHLNRTALLYYVSLFSFCITDISKLNSKHVGRSGCHKSCHETIQLHYL